jgi:predicted Zn-dependent peptidase
LAEILYEPKLIRGSFRKKTVAEEVRLLKEDFEAEYADKTEYAYNRFMNLMFQKELHRHRSKGEYETLDSVTPERLAMAYRNLLEQDHVTILAVGNFDFDDLAAEIAKRFRFGTPEGQLRWLDTENPETIVPRKVEEAGEVNQAKLNVGYRLDVRFGDSEYYAAVVANAVFGEFDHSKLFQTVREKHTLCYYINSLYDSNKGFISVMAGTDPDKAEKALSLIGEILKEMQDGQITEEELMLAKATLSKRIRQNADSPDRLATLDFMYHQIFGFPYSTERSLAAIAAVTKEAVLAMSQRIVLDTTYVFTGRDPQ